MEKWTQASFMDDFGYAESLRGELVDFGETADLCLPGELPSEFVLGYIG
jgi:hypothetical protein